MVSIPLFFIWLLRESGKTYEINFLFYDSGCIRPVSLFIFYLKSKITKRELLKFMNFVFQIFILQTELCRNEDQM